MKAAEDGDAAQDADVALAHAIRSADDPAYDALADQTVTVSITEKDDPAVTVSFEMGTYSVAEGSTVTVKVHLSTDPGRSVTIPITTTNEGGATGGDYSGVPASVTFASGDTEESFTFTATQDTVDDDSESVKLGFGTLPARVTVGTTNEATVSITDNDNPAVGVMVSFEEEVHYTIEGASGAAGVEVVLSAPLQTEVTIPVTVLSQSTAGSEDYLVDYTAGMASGPGLTFSPGETFGYVLIKAVLDTEDEETETVVLGFGTLPAGVSEGTPSRSTVEIEDAVQVSFAESSYMVEEGGDGVEVVVKLNKPSNNLRVPLTANGHGGADSSDFTGVPQEVVFKDGKTEEAFTFVAMEDSEEENGEMVRLGFGAFSEGMVAIFPDSAMMMIDDAGVPAPRHFAPSWPTQTSITLNWFTVETAAEYKLEFRKDGETDWTRISGGFDHLPSTSDHRDAFGVAAGLECETRYDFRVSARGSGETRNNGSRYSPSLFGSYATTSAQTGECAQEEEVTNLLVSVEPACATLIWTPPSGGRDTSYRVERYSYTGNRSHRSEPVTLAEQANHVANRYEDCSAEYRTPGADHVYIVSSLDDEGKEFGSAYTSLLVYSPYRELEGPLNVRLTHDTQSSRGLAWDAPRDPWLTTVKTARAWSGRQQMTLDPWTTGYRVERREYRRTEGGGWVLQGDWETLRNETDGDTGTSFTDSEDKGSKQYVYRVWAYSDWGLSRYSWRGDWAFNGGDPGGDPEPAEYIPPPPVQRQGGETPATGAPSISGTPRVGETLMASTSGIADADGLTKVSYRYQWIANNGTMDSDLQDATASTYTPSVNDLGKTIKVKVSFNDDVGNDESLTSVATAAIAATVPTAPSGLTVIRGSQIQELDSSWQAPSFNGGSAVTGYKVQWKEAADSWDTATDVSEAPVTGTTHTITGLTGGVVYAVRVIATNDAGDSPASTQATETPAGGTSEQNNEPDNNAPTGLPTITGTPQVEQTLTADSSGISDQDGLSNVSYRYQWIAGGADIDGATGPSLALTASQQGQTIQVRVTFTDDAGNDESLTSVATDAVTAKPTPLTATYSNVPASHDGSTEFTFDLAFSENIPLSYITLRDHAFTVDNGDVTKAQRKVQGSNLTWTITVDPRGNGAISITLPASMNCDDEGAICTDDKRKLSHSTSVAIAGPE